MVIPVMERISWARYISKAVTVEELAVEDLVLCLGKYANPVVLAYDVQLLKGLLAEEPDAGGLFPVTDCILHKVEEHA